jgi:homogentisate 1,2-dioxygenase
MELLFLKALARRSLPLTFSGREEVAALRKLSDANNVRATFVKEAGGDELVVVHEITEQGEASLATELGRNVEEPGLRGNTSDA